MAAAAALQHPDPDGSRSSRPPPRRPPLLLLAASHRAGSGATSQSAMAALPPNRPRRRSLPIGHVGTPSHGQRVLPRPPNRQRVPPLTGGVHSAVDLAAPVILLPLMALPAYARHDRSTCTEIRITLAHLLEAEEVLSAAGSCFVFYDTSMVNRVCCYMH